MNLWKIQEAKARLGDLIDRALSEGPQHIIRRGKPVVVVLSEEAYRRVTAKQSGGDTDGSLIELMRRCPAPEIFDFIEESRLRDAEPGR